MVARITDTGLGGPLIGKLLLDRIKQGALHDRRLLAGQDVALVSDLADIEPVAQEIEQRSPPERDATAGATGRKQPCLGVDVALLEISNQSIDAAEFEIAPKDQSDLPAVPNAVVGPIPPKAMAGHVGRRDLQLVGGAGKLPWPTTVAKTSKTRRRSMHPRSFRKTELCNYNLCLLSRSVKV